MKKLKRFLFCLMIIFSGINTLLASNNNTCRIVIYRNDTIEDYHSSYKVYMNDSVITKLKNKIYYSFYVGEGKVNLKINNPHLSKISLSPKKNRTYFIKISPNPISTDSAAIFSLVDSTLARKEFIRNCIADKAPKKEEVIKPINSIGFNIGGGFGLDKTSVIYTTDYKDVFISYGGGFDVGLNYTLEFYKYMGLSCDLGYKRSYLYPSIDNGSIHFERKNISFTPICIIPLNHLETSRLKLGIGGDFYLSPVMTIDISKLKDGFGDTWKYKNNQGYHISAFYEQLMHNNMSVNMGICYYNVVFNFDSGENYHPTSDNLIHGQGGGINIIGGFGYHF